MSDEHEGSVRRTRLAAGVTLIAVGAACAPYVLRAQGQLPTTPPNGGAVQPVTSGDDAGYADRRAATIDDALAWVKPPTVVAAPMGGRIALLMYRSNLDDHPVSVMYNNKYPSDVAVYVAETHRLIAVTSGRGAGVDYDNIQWSPDGTKLAFQAADSTGTVQLMYWDASTQGIRSIGPVMPPIGVTNDRRWSGILYAWASDSTLVLFATPPNRAWVTDVLLPERAATLGWHTQRGGVTPSVSVLDAGPDVAPSLLRAALLLVNIRSGDIRELARMDLMPEDQFVRMTLSMSPDGRALAFLTDAIGPLPSLGARFDQAHSGPFRVGLAALDHVAPVRWAQWDSVGFRETVFLPWGIPDWTPLDRIVWAPNSSAVALVGDRMPHGALGVMSVGDTMPRLERWRGMVIHDLRWTNQQAPLAYATRADGRGDWYRLWLRSSHAPRPLTATLPSAPRDLLTIRGSTLAYYVCGGALWSLDTEVGAVRRLTDSTLRATAIAWADTVGRGMHGGRSVYPTRLALSAGTTTSSATFLVDLTADGRVAHVTPLRRLAGDNRRGRDDVQVIASDLVLTPTESAAGVGRLIAADARGTWSDTLATVNSYLDHVVGARRFSVAFQSADGDSLYADVTLPVNYVQGKRYPMITLVYPGDVHPRTADTTLDRLDLWAAHGYVVLEPTMRLTGRIDGPGDQWLDVTKSVLPAVDRVVELGYADAERVGVWGHSMGGFAVYALITQTHRFKAAVAEAGPVNLMSSYGQFSFVDRYANSGAQRTSGAYSWAWEHGQARLGGPPWADLWRYWRNSPVNYFDRAETPLFIVQGDLDAVPIEQGEEAFTALLRLGKRVAFARYWGEAHNLTSPANIRDKWLREFAWFDKYLGNGSTGAGKPQDPRTPPVSVR